MSESSFYHCIASTVNVLLKERRCGKTGPSGRVSLDPAVDKIHWIKKLMSQKIDCIHLTPKCLLGIAFLLKCEGKKSEEKKLPLGRNSFHPKVGNKCPRKLSVFI